MECIIFSYNRPAQLDLLLRSMERFTDFKDVTVIYRYDKEYDYNKVISNFAWVKFIHQVDKNLKLYTQKALQSDLTAFFCDDDIFIGKVSLKDKQFRVFKKDEDILCLSLRLGKNVNYSFDQNRPIRTENELWQWRGRDLDWGYPMSVSGHVFRTEDLKPLIDKIEFNTPTQLESQMVMRPINRGWMLRYPKQKCVESPINVVQSECFSNKTGDVSVKWLNDNFQNGLRIDLDHILTNKFNSPHQLVEVKWES